MNFGLNIITRKSSSSWSYKVEKRESAKFPGTSQTPQLWAWKSGRTNVLLNFRQVLRVGLFGFALHPDAGFMLFIGKAFLLCWCSLFLESGGVFLVLVFPIEFPIRHIVRLWSWLTPIFKWQWSFYWSCWPFLATVRRRRFSPLLVNLLSIHIGYSAPGYY